MTPVRFEFATATEIVFGAGTRAGVAERVASLGRTALVVTGHDASRAAWLHDGLRAAGVTTVAASTYGEPTIDTTREVLEVARQAKANVVVALGGGSPIDLGKAVAALLTNPGDPLDFVEVIGRGRPIAQRSAPLVALPTTAGAGTEVTRNAVLSARGAGVKVSMRSALMLPRLAVIDPELTLDLPPAVTAATGMDALTQVVEPFLSPRANPVVDGFCLEGMHRVSRSLRRAFLDGHDLDARTDMALAALLGGLSLANAGLGAVHGFAAPVGGRFPAPHGAVCAALLPGVMRVNLRALRARHASSPALQRFPVVARALTGRQDAAAEDGLAWLEQLRGDLGIPPLSRYGVTRADVASLVEAASRASSMKGNCVVLERDELVEALEAAL